MIDSGNSIPLDGHLIKTVWLSPIVEMQCGQGMLNVIKISRISWPASFIGYNLDICVLLPICTSHFEISGIQMFAGSQIYPTIS